MPCPESSTRLQAYFDGELDALAAAAVEQHLEHCAECREMLEDLGQIRTVIRRDVPYERAPSELRARISRALDAESLDAPSTDTPSTGERAAAIGPTVGRARAPRSAHWRGRTFWAGAAGGFGGAVLAAGVAFLMLAPPANDALLDELVNAHVRSLMPAHLIDVESTDRHTVKPWFAGHADVSPVVADFALQGYRLIGGRADYFGRQRAAVVVYQHGAHVINVFSWAADRRALAGDNTRNGYHLACWQAGNLDYCAVSDTGWDELKGLERLIRDQAAADARAQG
jgi:mycothiol system anti-sigma-R factor